MSDSQAPIESVAQFGALIDNWVKFLQRTMEHLQNIPEEALAFLELQESEVPENLQGDFHKGFQVGIRLASLLVSEVPYNAEVSTDVPEHPGS